MYAIYHYPFLSLIRTVTLAISVHVYISSARNEMLTGKAWGTEANVSVCVPVSTCVRGFIITQSLQLWFIWGVGIQLVAFGGVVDVYIAET